MPGVIDPFTTILSGLPGIWAPVTDALSPEDTVAEIEAQAQASLLAVVDNPETILRLLLNECAIERAYTPPEGFDPELQGEWDDNMVTFKFKRNITLDEETREVNYLYIEYDFGDLGHWAMEIEPEKFSLARV